VTHLIVVEPESERPVGVLSSSDIVRSLALG
jgi:CBS domain-containing protein